jgi:anti-sigma factor RsiW
MLLHGLLDEELDAANTVAAETHLKTCEGCNAEFLRLQALREAVQAPGVAHRAPESLRARIDADLLAEATPARAPPRARRNAPWLASGGMAAIAAGFAIVVVAPQMAQAALERQLVASHVRSLLANHLTDIATSNQHVVRPWFNGKVDIAPPAPELADQGFPLVGGRLDYIEGRVAPAIVYRRHLHTINLFVLPEGHGLTGLRTTRRDGYSLVEWTQGGLRFAAVSDVELADLKQFRTAFVAASPS